MNGVLFLQVVVLFIPVTVVTTSPPCLSEVNDPCLAGNHIEMDEHTRSTAFTDPNLNYEADHSLLEGWYKVVSGAGGDMPTSVPDPGQCQAISPIWLQGVLPTSEEGIVERTTCVNFVTECALTIDICVKNCSSFNVYHLYRPDSSYERYCFGSELPCPEGQTSANGFTPGCVNITLAPQCVYESNDPCLPENYNELDEYTRSSAFFDPDQATMADHSLVEGWISPTSGAGGDMPTSPPGVGQCQATAPIWLQDGLPSSGEGIVHKTACVEFLSNCSTTIDICVKNCESFNVYYLYRPETSYERYCFGSELPCPTGYTSDNGFTPNCTELPTTQHTTTDTVSTTTTPTPIECVNEPNDPCLEGNYMTLDDYTRSTAYLDPNLSLEADLSLVQGWYKAISGAGGDMPTSPPGVGQCQATAPIWLQDGLPSSREGIVHKTACVEFLSNCSTTIDICVKNCDSFNVYYLHRPASAYERYCFGSELPCPSGFTSLTGFTPGCVATTVAPIPDCVNEINDPCQEQNYRIIDDYTRSSSYGNLEESFNADHILVEGWYRVTSGAGGDMPTSPPGIGKCQAVAPIWLQDGLPSSGEGIVHKTACVEFLSNCSTTIDICVKNCNSFNVYYLHRPASAYERYCFGSELPCTSSTGFTPDCEDNPSPECINEQNDPCLAHNYNTLNDYTRSSSYYNSANEYQSDTGLAEGWYRAIHDLGGDMPMSAPDAGRCQAQSPIWMNGSLPLSTEGIVERTACIRGGASECTESFDMCVKNCDYFNVYYLYTPQVTEQRYCFGSGQPCNMGSSDEFTPDCEATSNHNALVIALGVVAAGLVVIFVIIILIICKKKSSDPKVTTTNSSPSNGHHGRNNMYAVFESSQPDRVIISRPPATENLRMGTHPPTYLDGNRMMSTYPDGNRTMSPPPPYQERGAMMSPPPEYNVYNNIDDEYSQHKCAPERSHSNTSLNGYQVERPHSSNSLYSYHK